MTPLEYNKEIKLKIDVNGYYVFCDKNHPLAYKSNNTVYLHRHMASIKLGRWIEKHEHVHHIDGNKRNNSLENLMILSHSDHGKLHGLEYRKEKICSICQSPFYPTNACSTVFCSETCKKEYKRQTKINWPEPEEMQKLLWEMTSQKIGNQLGVTDKAVEKFAKKHNLNKPGRGYWQKLQVGILK